MEYPKKIYLDGYTYTPITSIFISLYPDGRLTYLWNGIENNYGKYNFENKMRVKI